MQLQNFGRFSLTAIIVFVLFNGFAAAQTNSSKPDIRVERLAGLAKVWGAVKFFHPSLAYREIDWDKALVEAIPRVNAAKTPQEYEAAINSMLAALGDKNTQARIAPDAPKKVADTTAATEEKEPVRLENGVLTIDGAVLAQTLAKGGEQTPELVGKTNQMFLQAKAVVIDLRSIAGIGELEVYDLDVYLRSVLPAMLDRNVPLSSLRYRLHNGYAPQTGSTSGGYYSGLMTDAPETLAGLNKAKTPPVIVLIDAEPRFAKIIAGLQAAKIAFVVQDGEALKEPGVPDYAIKLPEAVEVKMRTAELVGADGTIGFAADLVAPKGEAERAARQILAENKFVSKRTSAAQTFAAQISQKDKPYAEMEFPSAEYRLLALFRFWTVINYFFPYKHLIDEPWDNVLPRYIPRFEANKDAADYQLTAREMVAEIQDTHGFVRGTTKSAERMGRFSPPLVLKFLENQTVVAGVLENVEGIRVGDRITAVDGVPIEKVRDDYARYFAASTPQSSMLIVHRDLLRGQQNSRRKLTVRGAMDGATRTVEVTTSVAPNDPRWQTIENQEKKLPVFTVLPSGYGYADLNRLTVGEVDKMFEALKNAPAIIFDMRGYPNGTAWAIAPRLTEKRNVTGALFSRPIWSGKDLGDPNFPNGTNYTFAQTLPERAENQSVYRGKVVMLIDENAISQAEHTALFFEAATDVTFVGTPTLGANGDVTNVVLPGNLIAHFSGHDVRHADGRQLQRIGIQPHVKVAPTVRASLIENRDEILEAAIKFLQSGVKR